MNVTGQSNKNKTKKSPAEQQKQIKEIITSKKTSISKLNQRLSVAANDSDHSKHRQRFAHRKFDMGNMPTTFRHDDTLMARRNQSQLPSVEGARKVRGRPFQPGNPGRPLGSKNKATLMLEKLGEKTRRGIRSENG